MGTQDELGSFDHARKSWIPRRPNGKPIAPSTLWRWVWRGLQGADDGKRVKLAVTYVGNRPYVRRSDLEVFFQQVTEAKLERHRRAEELASDVSDDELKAVGLR
ncbi:MAG: hypothetical protein RIK87_13535 [Fuerstiella sp.]